MRPARVRAEDVRQMLGLADRTRIIDLFEALMRGDMAKALGELRDQYDSGADPRSCCPISPSSRISSRA